MMDMKNGEYIDMQQQYAHLTEKALKLGASTCVAMESKVIQVKDDLAALCNGEYTCPNYGLGASCPPNVEGPAEFRKWQAQSQYSIIVKIELPSSIMFSNERKGVMRLLHQIVAGVEQKAIETGFEKSKAFAGGSCKDLFCDDQENCCILSENKPCRHIESARPSMSGFGIDVTQLMTSCGWPGQKAERSDAFDNESTSWVVGLILLA
jgi:predicted metal-binding protein